MKILFQAVHGDLGSDRAVSPEKLELRRGLLEILERSLGRRGCVCLTVDREVEVEAIFERPAEHRPAVEARQVYVSARETIQSMREAARPMRRDKSERALRQRSTVARSRRTSLFDNHEPRAIFGIVLYRLGQDVDPVALRRRAARDRRGPRLALLGDRARRAGGVMEGNGFDLARVEVAAALGEGLRLR